MCTSLSRHHFKGELHFSCSASCYSQLTYFITHYSTEASILFQILQQSIHHGKRIEIQNSTPRCYQVWLELNGRTALNLPPSPAELMCTHLQMCYRCVSGGYSPGGTCDEPQLGQPLCPWVLPLLRSRSRAAQSSWNTKGRW